MKTRTLNSLIVALAGAVWWPATGYAVVPTEFELSQSAAWAAAKFKAVMDTAKPGPGLYVLANNDPVQLNARAGQPLRIVDKSYTRGLYCHAMSRIIMRLPAGGAEFTATAGVAAIVFDRFHITQLVNQKLDDLRRELVREATGLMKQTVKGVRYLLLMRRDNIEEEKLPRLDEALKHNEPLFTGYLLKEALGLLWE